MLKKFVIILLALICFCAIPAQASDICIKTPSSIIFFEDGSYITITIEELPMRASGTKSGHKNLTYTAKDGTICWQATLSGTFTYTGTSATCTSSTCDVTIYENAFYVVSKTANRSGNTATATVTMGRKVLGITISKDTYNMSLSCDANGNLS